MKERPILFNDEMVRAILDGRKTQTRRVMKPQMERRPVKDACGIVVAEPLCFKTRGIDHWLIWPNARETIECYSPYGTVGDRLWVREKFSTHVRIDDPYYLPPDYPDAAMGAWYWADGNRPTHGDWKKPKPSIHMPRWASRITLEITGVRVEQVQQITEDDARAEGCEPLVIDGAVECGRRKTNFQKLWNSINAPRGHAWESNPWVWVIEFKRVEQEGAAA